METSCPGFEILETGGISCDLKENILHMHNDLRNSIASGSVEGQPPASNMRELYWDDELAEGAQKWANHCTFAHNSEEDRRVERFRRVGQNIGITRSRSLHPSDKKDFARQIQKWFDENIYFHFNPINPKDVQNSGHYTQLAWANTYLVGCGFTRYRDQNVTYRLYVCNYGSAGNTFASLPYNKGNLNCPEGFSPSVNYPALCSKNNREDLICEDSDDKSINSASSSLPPSMETRKSLPEDLGYFEKDEKDDSAVEDRRLLNAIVAAPEDRGSRDGVYVKDLRVDTMYNIFYYWRSRD
ncbi:scoloptoxin SSD976 [Microplitis demolitor]|uniref:scoloptoxin SSD976 n=1 Tax=Microplitis demolitor TaxID=69319 RepID=UPI0004CCF437|nr:scoloptoxin SSD976 [Microplitis demolitor]